MRKAFLYVCLLQLILVGLLRAQANRATITGTLTDSSGAPMVGVTATAKNLGTNVSTMAVTNENGIYSIPNLFPGTYSLDFRKDGFKPIVYPSVTLESTQVAEINVALLVGSVNESITVTADAPVLDHETAAIGTNMNGDVVTDLPLSIYGGGRFVENFAIAITPGYSPISSTYEAVINGNQGFTKDFTVDGTSGTAQIQGDSIEIGPGMEAVQELQAQTSGLDSQSSITNGGVISFNLKSGTNQFHGSAFGYGHNELLDARVWGASAKTKARSWDYGGSLGGPIIKNKTFFFGTFERYTQHDFTLGSFGQAATLPTPSFLQGNFSALLNTSDLLGTDIHGNPIYAGAIFNPTDPGAVFVGNQIPTSMFSAVSQKIVALYQKYYVPQGAGITNNDLFPDQGVPSQTPNRAVVKIDHNFRTNDKLSGSWIYSHLPTLKLDSGGVWEPGSTDGGPLADARNQLVYAHEWRLSESHTFSSNMVNVLNWTYNWYWNGSLPASAGTTWPTTLGFPATGADNFPAISFGGGINNGVINASTTGIGNQWQGDYVGATMITGDSLTWTKGRHAFTFGGDFRAYEINSHTGSGALAFNFNPATTSVPAYAGQTGFGFASFLLGDVTSAMQTTPFDLYGRRKALSLFAQDSWKLTQKLTVNFGLRWDYTFRFHEKYGHWANFDETAIDPTLGIPGTLEFAKSGSDSFEKNEYATNFGPQIGLAYSPWKKVVFRGSFGILYVPIGIQYYSGVPYGFAPGFQGTNTVNSAFNWAGGNYPGVLQPGSTNVDVTQLIPVVIVDPRSLRAGYSDTINLGVQYQLTPNMRLEVAYVGNRGHRLPDTALDYNEPSSKEFFKFINEGLPYDPYDSTGLSYVCNPAQAASFGIKYPYPGFCGSLYAAIAPFPQLANTMDFDYYDQIYYVGLPLAQTYYNSMIVDVTKRYGKGLTMDMNYTLSRQQGDTYTAFQATYADYTPIQDFSNISQAAHTLTNYDQTHVVKGFVSYQLPLGNGRRWLSDKGRFVNGVVGGWTVAGLVLYASGQPFQVGAQNPYYPAWGNILPDFNLTGNISPIFHPGQYVAPTSANSSPATDFYLPAGIASSPAYGQLGTGPSAVGALRCPGIANEDASLLKYFSMGADGRYKLSFRTEFYNLFNRHTWGIQGCGGTTFGLPAAGSPAEPIGFVTGVNSAPRTGQFAVRFTF